MINSQTKQFQQDLTNLVNHSGLPVVNAYYVIKNICQQLEILYNQQIQQELKEQQEEKNMTLDAAAIKKNLDNINDIEETEQADE